MHRRHRLRAKRGRALDPLQLFASRATAAGFGYAANVSGDQGAGAFGHGRFIVFLDDFVDHPDSSHKDTMDGRRRFADGDRSSWRASMRFLLAATLIAIARSALAASLPPLSEYEGQYEYRDGLSVYMVAQGEQRAAIIDQSKYL